jgi:hypothetical protein
MHQASWHCVACFCTLTEVHIACKQCDVLHKRELVLRLQAMPMSTLKVVDFGQLNSSEAAFWRLCLRHFLLEFKDDAAMSAVLARTAGKRSLQSGLRAFLRNVMGPWVAQGKGGAAGLSAEQHEALLLRTHHAEKCLAAVAKAR